MTVEANSSNETISTGPPKWLPWVAILVVSIIWPFVGYAAKLAWDSNSNKVEDWLPQSFQETKDLYAFAEKFGSDEFLMISWKGCVLDDPRSSDLVELLRSPADDGITYFSMVSTGGQVIDSLLESNRQLEHKHALKKLSGIFVGFDKKQTCVVASLSSGGIRNRERAVQWARVAASRATKLGDEDIHIAGSTVDSVAIDEASRAYLVELNMLSSLTCLVILAISIRNVWLVGCVFLCAIFNEQLALAIIYITGGHVDSIQLLVANLAFVLSVSAGLHYLGYYRDMVHAGAPNPAWAAVKASMSPSILAAVTTSLGFVSLCTSQIVPIRNFGFYAALVVPINAVIVTSLLAIHATWASNHNWCWRRIKPVIDNTSHHARWPSKLVNFVGEAPIVIIVVWLLGVGAIGWGLKDLKTSVGTHKLLPPHSKLLSDYAWLEDNIGALIPVELVLRLPKEEVQEGQQPKLRLIERMRILATLQDRLEHVADVKVTMSALNFISDLPKDGGIGNVAKRAVFDKLLSNSMQRFRDMRLLHDEGDEQCWRLSGRVLASRPPDYEPMLKEISNLIYFLKKDYPEIKLEVDVSGGVPFVYRTQRQLLLDLISSFSSAFAMIAISMALMFRSISAGLVSMIPNVTPAAVIFGAMGLMQWEVELGTVLTASVIMGVCVDDTLHLISHFRMAREKGLPQKLAVIDALANCGGAMVQTALVCGLGMLVFSLSPFIPVARFAWLTFSLLMVGLLSDLVLTPAVLLTPLHHVFYREPRRK